MNGSSLRGAAEFLSLLSYPERTDTAPNLEAELATAKAAAVAANDETHAELYWQAQTILSIQREFREAFDKLKAGEFYPAWCQLERCEIQIASLLRHYVPEPEDEHRIAYIRRMIERWQALFPYKVFFSPEFLKKRIVCSICKARVTPRTPCGHRKGRIYGGEECYHIVEDVVMLGISIVDQPVQKYSVAFLAGPDGQRGDHYDYGTVRFVAERADSAFQEWRSERTTRTISASEVAHLGADDPCPCLSGKTFGACCAGASELTVPHLQITFAGPIRKGLPENELMF